MNALAEPCAHCGRSEPALDRVPFAGPIGEEIRRRICALCWAEWQRAEVMVINELQLNFMDPASQDILSAEMRRFLGLDGAGGAPDSAG